MPLQATSGAASYDAFGGGAAVAPKYIEDFFQTWLRTGTGASATVTTGLNGSINETMVWTKSRSAATNHKLTDNVRGATKALSSNTTGAEVTDSQGLTAFSSTGYTIGTNTDYNNSGATYVDGQFVATPKFFDVVTWTGNDAASRQIAHNLGSTPGCVIVKATNNTKDWYVSHRSLATANAYLNLNTTAASAAGQNWGNSGGTRPTSTDFTVGDNTNVSGYTYVAYLFAHNAGGFGLTGTDNVISCGSYTGTGSTQQITLGYEPQWVMIKRTDTVDSWIMVDNMRGFFQTADNALCANNANAEAATVSMSGAMQPTATGFSLFNANSAVNDSGGTYIYIAIRRGPMKVPTSGTSVFSPVQNSSFTAGAVIPGQSRVDMSWSKQKDADNSMRIFDRLRGSSTSTNLTLNPAATSSETNEAFWAMDQQNGVRITQTFTGTFNYINYFYTRAPGFFDEVCYTGDGVSGRSIAHNLGVAPELIITKDRSRAGTSWTVWNKDLPSGYVLILQYSNPQDNGWGTNYIGTPGASSYQVGLTERVNQSGDTYVAYLFASCPGVSKVGSYTGTGATQVINCGFTAGARFVLIKATSTTGDWYVWDSARGIVSGNDPYLELNTTDAEVTNTDWVDTAASGFELSNAAGNLANSNGVSYVFFAVA